MADSANNNIRIRLFAGLREQAGWSERQWAQAPSPEESLTPRQLWQRLELPGQLIDLRVAINQEFTEADTPLKAGDELAFLPPISGG